MQEVATSEKNDLVISLAEDSEVLDEVVVIGYGTVRRSDLTGAISQINPTKKVEKLTSNATDLLRNSIAGLYMPFSTSAKGDIDLNNALIRGTTSLKASNAPLIVLDGVIYDGDMANISSADIETIDVMKDASSAAIYGSRSANGVINITTKKGATGAPTINFNMNIGFSSPSYLREVLSPEEYIDMRSTLFQYTAPMDNHPGYYNNPNNLPGGVSLEQWMEYNNATGDPVDIWLTRLRMDPLEIGNYKQGKSTDWADHLFQTGLRQDYLTSISGGSDKTKYYWSVNYSDNEGFIVGQEYSSVRSRLNVESKISNFLDIGINAQYANRDEGGIAANWGAYSNLSPLGLLYNDDGSLRYAPSGNLQTGTNPLIDRAYNERYMKINDLNTRIYAIVTLPFGISYQLNVINNFAQSRNYEHVSSLNPNNATNGSAFRQNNDSYMWNIENIVKWAKVFDQHRFDLTLLANAEKYQSFSNRQSNTQFSPSDILGYHHMGAGSAPVITSDDVASTRDALLGRLNYTFRDKYLLTASIRRDGYSAFGQDNPHATFPSVALAWRLSEESFFNVEKIDQLKIRASWGANGNSAIGAYDALAVLTGGKHLYATDAGAAYIVSRLNIDRMQNPNLKWEKTGAYNIGIDFSLFKYRLNGTIEGYLSKTTDLLVDRSLPNVTGYSAITANMGQVNNKGIELTLNSRNMEIADKFEWQTFFNASYNKNKIVHLYGDMVNTYDSQGNIIGTKESDDYENQWFIGHSIDAIWDYRPNGVWQVEDAVLANSYGGYLPGEYRMVDVNNDGLYTELADKQFLGYSKPQFRWNMMNDFTLFQNFSVSFSLYGHHGWKKNWAEKFGEERSSDYKIPYWTPENRSNKYSRMSNRDGDPKPQSNYVNMGFVRLSDISVGYLFPKNITDMLHTQSLKIYGSIQNVAVWTKWEGWDPENTGGTSPRYYNLGINLTF
jgi:TonB-linked SusC/RagA family outer membrane protein